MGENKMVKEVSLEQVEKALAKVKTGSVEYVRKILIESINKELSNNDKRRSIVKTGNDGETYVVLSYANIKVKALSVDSNNIAEELNEIKKMLGTKKYDSAIKTMLDSEDYKEYAKKMTNMRAKLQK